MSFLPHINKLLIASILLVTIAPAKADFSYELGKMVGFTIIYSGNLSGTLEKEYSEKYIKLDNGWIFKLNCMILTPLYMSNVIVFAKKYPDEVLNKHPNLSKNFQFNFKLLIDRDVCDATLIKD